MPATNCIVCNAEISASNDSSEHVIPNSIGGRLEIKGFICRACNNDAGRVWDASLAKQLNSLSLFFGITRSRGEVPSQVIPTTAGEKLVLHASGSFSPEKPTYVETPNESGVTIQITARTKREARTMLEGVKRKYPSTDIHELLRNAEISSAYPKGMLNLSLSFGGEISGRSIVKTALAFAHYCRIDTAQCQVARSYLQDDKATACFGYYYADDLIVDRPKNTPLHYVAISGNPDTGLLLAYVEYFGVQRVVVCLSDSYVGPALNYAYAIDPVTGKEAQVHFRCELSRTDIEGIYAYEMIPAGALEQAFSDVLPTGIKKSVDKERARVVDEAIRYAFANCGAKEGELLTTAHINRVSRLAAEKMMPFIMHMMKPKR